MAEELLRRLRQMLQEGFPGEMSYGEYVGQGFHRPGFFTELKRIIMRRGVGGRYRIRADVEIRFYDDERSGQGAADRNGRLHRRAMELYDVLDLPGMISLEMSHSIKNGILIVTASYVFYAEKSQAEFGAFMKTINLEME
ncbi:MAG: hypothetical protein U0M15_06060 [Bacillota bacterium]|nr:hypothetical protein [Bacillota bacterium]